MLSKREEERRNQLEIVALDELVPEDHLISFMILSKDYYSSDNGR
ncbi:hypothetical protein BN2127_JRS3_02046 [Bacillus safensis]|nr:hypothetical protein [Bacillus safensis]KIL18519.1 hypothetical protein B4129_1576 [Bacillus safensis]CUB19836.1 hypothetical protein BN2127_JRS3_02046 [Bacillus safensis]